jgi:hypothetical protein
MAHNVEYGSVKLCEIAVAGWQTLINKADKPVIQRHTLQDFGLELSDDGARSGGSRTVCTQMAAFVRHDGG